MLVRFEKVPSPLCSFCKSSEETAAHLLSIFSLSQNIWSQTQVFFSNYFTIPNILLVLACASMTRKWGVPSANSTAKQPVMDTTIRKTLFWFIASSPDVLVVYQASEKKLLLELKCSHAKRHMSPIELFQIQIFM